MKKLSLILMALALVMVFTQCKKEKLTESNNDFVLEGETYHINLALSNGSNSRVQVHPLDDVQGVNGIGVAPVVFEKGDSILVAYNGKHAGVLYFDENVSGAPDPVNTGYNMGVFTGDITATVSGEHPLQFFFLGNKKEHAGLEFTGSGGIATGYTVDISDQTASLPVISYASSKQTFTGSGEYTVPGNWLLNQCALVKFKSVNIYHNGTNSVDNNDDALFVTDKQITIEGVNNFMTISLGADAPTFTPSQVNDGKIQLNNIVKANATEADSVRYAIVLAGDYSVEKDLEVAFDYAEDKYGFTGTYQIGEEVAINDYCTDAELRLVWHSGAFIISSTEYVVFSRGNLQYNDSYNTDEPAKAWRFAKHQYDWVGGTVSKSGSLTGTVRQGNVVLNENSSYCDPATNGHWSQNEQIGTSTYQGWIDLYGWGTATNPTEHRSLLTGGTYTWSKDWGENHISNSGLTNNSANSSYWVTMTKEEWVSLGNTLGASSLTTKRMAYGTVVGVHGMIFLPDLCPIPTGWYDYSNNSNVAGSEIDYTKNVYDAAAWKTMEQNGAVFLPASGYRGLLQSGTDYDGGYLDRQELGQYWSSSLSAGQQNSQSCYWAWSQSLTGSHNIEFNGDRTWDYGFAVRLVHRGTISSGSKFFNKKD